MGVSNQVKLLLVPAVVAASMGVAALSTNAAAQSSAIPQDQESCSDGTHVDSPSSNPGLVADCIALSAARNHIVSDPRNAGLDYDSLWKGATIRSGRVVEVDFYNLSIKGSIPAELGNLSNLEELDLSGNQLSGSIPGQLGNLSNLEELDLSGNQLSGSIPGQLGNLSNLESLDLSGNQLSGSIPTELGNLNKLNVLWLSGNQLSGSIPTELGNLNELHDLNLSGNKLSGSIPRQLGNLSNLRSLNLSGNKLSGSIPRQLGSLGNLRSLNLSGNKLSGSIPGQLGRLALNDLWVQNNRLSGEIPATLKVSGSFRFCNTRLAGALPEHLRNIANNFSGDIDNIASCYEGRFKDEDGSVHETNIEQIAEWRITLGCQKDRFCPSKTITRHQMAAFLYRAVTHLSGTPGRHADVQLSDVAADAWYRRQARWAVATKVMRTVDGKFNPSAAVTRADMAEMLVAAFDHLSASTELGGLFADVDDIPTSAIRAIEGISAAGVTKGCSTEPLKYCPNQEITRAQMASFLTRAIKPSGN